MSALPLEIVLAVARRTWVKTLRRPVVLSFSFVQPLMWMLFFGFLFERYALEDTSELAYLDFLAPGVCTMTVLFGASQSGISWIRDLQSGFLPRMLQTPASRHPVLAGKLLADVLRLMLQALVVLALATLLGARLDPALGALPGALLCLLLFAWAFASLSCAIALKTRAQEAMAVFVHVVNMPLLFTSTALVPDKQMPSWLASLSSYNPLTLTVDAWRGALLHARSPEPSVMAWLGFLALALYAVAAQAMKGAARQRG